MRVIIISSLNYTYSCDTDCVAEVFRMVQQGMPAKEIKEKLNMLYVKHTLLAAKKMHDEGDCISDNEITIAF